MSEMYSRGGQIKEKCSRKTARNGKIEFLRFIFAVIVVIHHSRNFLGDDISPFLGGSLGVEFFFFVSGYLMMATIEKRRKLADTPEVGRETAMYLLKKWISVFPEALISFAIAFAVMIIAKKPTVHGIILTFIDTIWELLFVSMTGLGKRGINSVVWYISAMLLCMAALYPLLRKYHDTMIHLVIPLASLCIFGYLYQNGGHARNPTKWLGWTYRGVLRAFAEIGIGCLLYYLSQSIRSVRLSKKGRWLITITENVCYLVILYYMYIVGATKYDYFFIFLMALAVALTFSGSGVDSECFNKRIIMWLGRFSVPLYFSHTFYSSYLDSFVPAHLNNSIRLLIYMVFSFITAFAVMNLAKYFRNVFPRITNSIGKVLIE